MQILEKASSAMMQDKAISWKRVTLVLVLAMLVTLALGCETFQLIFQPTIEADHHHHRGPDVVVAAPVPAVPVPGTYRYQYYPSAEVYFYPATGLYFWYQDGDWCSGVSLPAVIHLDLNEHVWLDLDDAVPYRHHDDHVHRYPSKMERHGDRAPRGVPAPPVPRGAPAPHAPGVVAPVPREVPAPHAPGVAVPAPGGVHAPNAPGVPAPPAAPGNLPAPPAPPAPPLP